MIQLADLSVQRLTARWHHNQDVPLQGEYDAGEVGEAQWELPSCFAENIMNNF
jgi:hypothetical protein